MQYQVQDPQGQLHVIDGPEGASPDEVLAQAQKLVPSTPKTPSFLDTMKDVATSAAKTALPSSDYLEPIKPDSSNPVIGAIQAAGQTLRDPTRISPTVSEPGNIAGEAIKDKTGSSIAGFTTKMLLDPQTYMGLGQSAETKTIPQAAEEFGAKYGGVSAHMPDYLTQVANLHAKSPEAAESFLDSTLPHMVRNGTDESGAGFANKFGEVGPKSSMPFSDDTIANQFKQEVLNKLSTHPVLKGQTDKGLDIAKPNLLQKVFNLFKQPTSPEDTETAVSNVQNMVKTATDKFGKELNTEKTLLDIPATKEDMEQSLKKFGNIYGIDKPIWKDPEYGQYLTETSNPNDLAKNIALFKENAGNMAPAIRAKIANFLQAQVQSKVDFDKAGGGQLNGLLKTQYGDLSKIVSNASKGLSGAKSKMADILDNVRFVQNKMEDPGQAQAFLQRLYNNPKGKNADYITALRKIESMTGKETLNELFNKFSSEQTLDLRHPIADMTKNVLQNMGIVARPIAKAASKPSFAIPGAMIGNSLINEESNRRALQSVRDRLRNRE